MINDFFGSYPLQEMSKFNTPFQIEEIYSVDFNDYKAIIDKIVKFFAEKKNSKLVSKLDLFQKWAYCLFKTTSTSSFTSSTFTSKSSRFSVSKIRYESSNKIIF